MLKSQVGSLSTRPISKLSEESRCLGELVAKLFEGCPSPEALPKVSPPKRPPLKRKLVGGFMGVGWLTN